jgi:hypothetical protein
MKKAVFQISQIFSEWIRVFDRSEKWKNNIEIFVGEKIKVLSIWSILDYK